MGLTAQDPYAIHRNPEDFQDFRNFGLAQQKLISKFASKHLGKLKADTMEAVRLVDFDLELLNLQKAARY